MGKGVGDQKLTDLDGVELTALGMSSARSQMSPARSSFETLLCVLFVCVIGVVGAIWPTGSDETSYALAALDMAEGRLPTELGRSIHANRVAYVGLLAIPLLILPMWEALLLWNALVAVCTLFTFRRLFLLFGVRGSAGPLLLALSPSLLFHPTMPEPLCILILALSMTCLLAASPRRDPPRRGSSYSRGLLFLAGALIGLLGAMHAGNIELVPALALLFLFAYPSKRKGSALILVLGGLSVILAEALFWVSVGESPLFRLQRLSQAGDAMALIPSPEDESQNLLRSLIGYVKSWFLPNVSAGMSLVVILIVVSISLFQRSSSSQREPDKVTREQQVPLGVVGACLGYAIFLCCNTALRVSTQGAIFGEIPWRYFATSIPFATLVIAACLARERQLKRGIQVRGIAALCALQAFVVISLVVLSSGRVLTSAPLELAVGEDIESQHVYCDRRTEKLLRLYGAKVEVLGNLDELPESGEPYKVLISSQVQELRKRLYKQVDNLNESAVVIAEWHANGPLTRLRREVLLMFGRTWESRSITLYRIDPESMES